MSEEKQEEKSRWQKIKDWADKNPVVSGAVTGGAAGSVVPGVGTVVGAIGGAAVGAIYKITK